MFCGECGTQNPETNRFCKNCGKPLRKLQSATAAQPGAMVHSPPVAAQPQVPPISYQPRPAPDMPPVENTPGTAAPQEPVKKGSDWLGIGSIIFALPAWLIVPYIFGCIAVILGIFSVYKKRKDQNALAIAGITGIVIAIGAMLVNYFYIFIF